MKFIERLASALHGKRRGAREKFNGYVERLADDPDAQLDVDEVAAVLDELGLSESDLAERVELTRELFTAQREAARVDDLKTRARTAAFELEAVVEKKAAAIRDFDSQLERLRQRQGGVRAELDQAQAAARRVRELRRALLPSEEERAEAREAERDAKNRARFAARAERELPAARRELEQARRELREVEARAQRDATDYHAARAAAGLRQAVARGERRVEELEARLGERETQSVES